MFKIALDKLTKPNVTRLLVDILVIVTILLLQIESIITIGFSNSSSIIPSIVFGMFAIDFIVMSIRFYKNWIKKV